MKQTAIYSLPVRISDLVELKKKGGEVTCHPSFEIIPVDFAHRDNKFQAYVFLCRFSGSVDGEPYSFRKCYARGCPHNLCPHVNQAVMIANRYLMRDYQRLNQSGMGIETRLFSLEDMLVKFADLREVHGPVITVDDYIDNARQGESVSIDITLEYVPTTEHFEYGKNLQTFLMADFAQVGSDRKLRCQRCLACYPTEKEVEEKQRQVAVANERLCELYRQFDDVSINYEKVFFG